MKVQFQFDFLTELIESEAVAVGESDGTAGDPLVVFSTAFLLRPGPSDQEGVDVDVAPLVLEHHRHVEGLKQEVKTRGN